MSDNISYFLKAKLMIAVFEWLYTWSEDTRFLF